MRRVIAALLLLLLASAAWARDTDKVNVGKPIEVRADETMGDIVCVGAPVRVYGKVQGDIVAVRSDTTIDGPVSGDVVVVAGKLRLGPNAVVRDIALAGSELERDPAAQVKGEISRAPGPANLGGLLLLIFFGVAFALIPLSLALAAICWAVAGRQRIETLAATLASHPGYSVLGGFVAMIIVIALSRLFHTMGPVRGLFTATLWLAVLLSVVLGYTGMSLWTGRKIGSTALAAVLFGALVIAVIQSVPVIGFFALAVFWWFALGVTLLSGAGTSPEWLINRMGSAPPPAPAIKT